MRETFVPTDWIPLHSLEPAHHPAARPGALAVLTQLEKARTVAAATEPDTGLLRVAIAAVNARVLHSKLSAREVLATEYEPQFAAYCRMISDSIDPLRYLLTPARTVTAARSTLAGARAELEALFAMAGGTAAGAPVIFDDVLNQLEATDLFLAAA